jgi:hypothetical protein
MVGTDLAGNFYVALPEMLFRVDTGGNLTRVAGSGAIWYNDSVSDGPALSVAVSPVGVAADRTGNLYIAEPSDVRKVSAAGIISTVVGAGDCQGTVGDGEPTTADGICDATGMAMDHSGNLYISDAHWSVVWKLSPNGGMTIVAGVGGIGYFGDGGPATAAALNSPVGLALDLAGGLLIADSANNVIRRVSPDGTIATVAGDGFRGYTGDNSGDPSRTE